MGWLYRIRICLISALALMLILLAIGFSVLRAVIPHATGYLDEIHTAIESTVGLPIEIEAVDADMHWLTPRLKLVGLTVLSEDGLEKIVQLEEVYFSLAYLDSLRQQQISVGKIELVGADISIERTHTGRWKIQGFELEGEQTAGEAEARKIIDTLERINLSLLDSTIHWQDFTGETENATLHDIDIRWQTSFGYYLIDLDTSLPDPFGEGMRLTAEIDGDLIRPESLSGLIYVQGRRLQVGKFVQSGKIATIDDYEGIADLEAWLKFETLDLKSLIADVQLESVAIDRSGRRAWQASQVNGLFRFIDRGSSWRVDASKLEIVTDDDAWTYKTDAIVSSSGEVLHVSADYLNIDILSSLIVASRDISTRIDQEYLTRDPGGEIYNLSMKIEDGEILSFDTEFENLAIRLDEQNGIDGFDGRIRKNGELFLVDMRGKGIVLKMGETFREPILLDVLHGTVEVKKSGDGLLVRSDELWMRNDDMDTMTRIALYPEDGQQMLDMQVDFRDVNTTELGRYYPVSMLSAELIDWLDRGIIGGHVDKGSYIFRGGTDDFPFYGNRGVMEVDFRVEDLKVDYLTSWPSVEGLDAHLRFYNQGLEIDDARGVVHGNEVTGLIAKIPDLNSPFLHIEGRTKSDASELQRFVKQSPLGEILGGSFDHFVLDGPAELAFDLEIPIEEDGPVSVDAAVGFRGVSLLYPAMSYRLDDIRGDLRFTESSMTAEAVSAGIEGEPVRIDVSTDGEIGSDRMSHFEIAGAIGIDTVLNSFDWIPEYWFSGASDWKIGIHLPLAEQDYDIRVDASTDLEGVGISVVDGILKSPGGESPIAVRVISSDDEINAKLEHGSFVIDGMRDDEDYWSLDVTSSILRGESRFKQSLPTDLKVVASIEYLDLGSFSRERIDSRGGDLLPAEIPPLVVSIDSLDWDGWALKDISFDTEWHPQGMVINNIIVNGPTLEVKGQGSWLYSWQHTHESSFKLNIQSTDLGNTLKELGISTALKSSAFEGQTDLSWQAPPYGFSWSGVKGQSVISLRNGQMQDVDPGAGGRLLGLFNVLQLHKRLFLNFGDVYEKGYVFDSVAATFDFENGDAKTERIDVVGAAANMKMFGRIGMQQRDYDLNLVVKPNSKAATFTGGTLAGGPALGAGLVLLQELFGLDEATQEQFSIKGPWTAPVIEKIKE